MRKRPLISVIVPIYKTEPYLRKCIDSILAQTYSEIELILIDDGSTDRCGAICEEYAQKDARVIVVRQSNTGQAGARNNGLEFAQGSYIGFVDSDDWVAPDMYQTLMQCLERHNADIAVCGRYTVRGDKITISTGFNLPEEMVMTNKEAVERFLTYQAMDASVVDKLFKREVLTDIRFPVEYICEDVPFVYNALKRAEKVVHCAKPLYYVLMREGSTSRSTFNQKGMGLYYYFKDVCQQCKKDFPQFEKQANYLFFKNLLVAAFRIADIKGYVLERKVVNGDVKSHIAEILSDKRLKKGYQLFACFVVLGLERVAVIVAKRLGFGIV